MNCERCGHELPPNSKICPDCGTVRATGRPSAQQATIYGMPPQRGFGESSSYPPGQAPSVQRASYPAAVPGYGPVYESSPHYRSSSSSNASRNDSALITEVLFSLFGVFGIGWLMARQTAIGIILLICSFLIYWPIVFVGTELTGGIGLICLGPLAVGLIILNAVLLNNLLHRKTARFGTPSRPTWPQE